MAMNGASILNNFLICSPCSKLWVKIRRTKLRGHGNLLPVTLDETLQRHRGP